MANKRKLKKLINQICEELFAEGVAASLYGPDVNKENSESLLASIVKMQGHYVRRVCHPEPGLSAKAYFKDLRDKFNVEVSDIVDQINF